MAPIVERLVDLIGGADGELSPLVGLAARKAKPRLAGIADHVPRARIATTVDRRRKYASDARPDRRCQNCGELYRGKRCKDCGFVPVSIDDAGADRQRVGAMAQARANRDWPGPAVIAISSATFCPDCRASRCAGSWRRPAYRSALPQNFEMASRFPSSALGAAASAAGTVAGRLAWS